jgi:hypothetical protein
MKLLVSAGIQKLNLSHVKQTVRKKYGSLFVFIASKKVGNQALIILFLAYRIGLHYCHIQQLSHLRSNLFLGNIQITQ